MHPQHPAVPIVFISSTVEDLKPYREAARDAAIRAGFFPEMCEYFPSSGNPPLDECMKRVDECDVLLVIAAYRYGWKPADQPTGPVKKSITWLECERAIKNGKEVLAFVVDPGYTWRIEYKEDYRFTEASLKGEPSETIRALCEDIPESKAGLAEFKKWIGNRTRNTFTEVHDLSEKIGASLHDWRNRHTEQFSPVRLKSDPHQYLQWLYTEFGSIDIRGLVVGSGKAHKFGIEELYIPLTTLSHDLMTMTTTTTVAPEEAKRFAGHEPVELHEALKHPLLAITGDPGSGKTTFLKRIAYLLSCMHLNIGADVSRKKLNLEKDYFPVFIRLGRLTEYILGCRRNSSSHALALADDPRWIINFCTEMSEGNNWGLDEDFFRDKLAAGEALILLDGLDEAPDIAIRESISEMVAGMVSAYPQNRFVITSRPLAFTGRVMLQNFNQVKIEPLGEDAVKLFLKRWSDSLHGTGTPQAQAYFQQLTEALISRYEIRCMASNPMMLTALAVVHWNEKRIPEQRAELYESVITWLLRSREQRPGRVPEKVCGERLQSLALVMQNHAEGRKTQLGRRAAAEQISHLFTEATEEKRIAAAEQFLAEEEVDSGIIVGRGVNEIAFWHLTFQEYLAAKALGGKKESDQQDIVVKPQRLHDPDWREVLTLFGGVLHEQGRDKVDGFMRAVLNLAGKGKPLVDEARCVGLLGAMLRDLAPFHYQIPDKRYGEMLDRVMAIFTVDGAKKVQLNDRLEAADALGQAGDPRIHDFRKKEYWIEIPACSFYMGAQKEDKKGRNYDPDAFDIESPVHKVTLSAYRIGRYPVTVSEYKLFIEENCYAERRHWNAGGFGMFKEPDRWGEQQKHPTRPVTGVSWFEAMAYAAWAEVLLPTEAQWERAARGAGTDYRKYPWGNNKEPDSFLANYYETKIGHPSPVGLFPAGATDEFIHDVAGNVWEWCQELGGKYSSETVTDPKGLRGGVGRVVRGGSWYNNAGRCRCATRYWNHPDYRYDYFGFRLSRGK